MSTVDTIGHLQPDYDLILVGAGFSGIGTAIALKRAGIDNFVILEKENTIGGTWRDNTYPGISVDVPSFHYQFSFDMNPNWKRAWASGAEIHSYQKYLVEKYGLERHIRFNSPVSKAVFNERDNLWEVHTTDTVISGRYLAPGIGPLTQPKQPDIPGVDTFEGKTIHTARWDHEYDLGGKRVAVIGTGASAIQLIPSIAPKVKRLTVFQRTPIWMAPRPNPSLDPIRPLLKVPGIQHLARYTTAGLYDAGTIAGVLLYRQIPAFNEAARKVLEGYLWTQVRDPKLRRRLTPDYGLGCKRPGLNSDYLKTFNLDHVDLETAPIEQITPTGVRTCEGIEREVDVLIYATGFKVFENGNTPPFRIYGLDGLELGDFWHRERYQAYEGITIPGFPNLFMIFGPYALGVSWTFMVEHQSHHLIRVINEAARHGATRVQVTAAANRRYFEKTLQRQENTIFFNGACSTANSYYFDHNGDAPYLRPTSAVQTWLRSRTFSLDDYTYDTTVATPPKQIAAERKPRSTAAKKSSSITRIGASR